MGKEWNEISTGKELSVRDINSALHLLFHVVELREKSRVRPASSQLARIISSPICVSNWPRVSNPPKCRGSGRDVGGGGWEGNGGGGEMKAKWNTLSCCLKSCSCNFCAYSQKWVWVVVGVQLSPEISPSHPAYPFIQVSCDSFPGAASMIKN